MFDFKEMKPLIDVKSLTPNYEFLDDNSVLPEQPVGSSEISQLNQDIFDQNRRFDRTGVLTYEELKQLTRVGISDEQIDTFQNLLEKAQVLDYEGRARAALDLERQIALIDEQIAALTSISERLQDEVELAAELAPRKTDEIHEFGEHEKERSDRMRRSHLLAQRALTCKKLDETNYSLANYYSEAWAIPKAISPEDRALLFDLVAGEEFDTKDIIPLTPDEKMHQADIVEHVKRTIEAPGASEFIAAYLADQTDRVVTVEQISRLLYIADVDGESHRSNVTTLLGPKIQGKRIAQKLNDEHNLSLQYGWRYLRQRVDGKLEFRRRTRIYRSVKTPNLDTESSVYENPEDYSQITDQWDKLSEVVVIPTTEEVVLNPQSKSTTVELVAEDITELKKIESQADNTECVAAMDNRVECNDGQIWQDKLRDEAIGVIEGLKEDRLFEDDVMRGSVIRALSSSNLLATRTGRDRMVSAGLMKRGEIKYDTMSRRQRVISALFNTNHALNNKVRSRQKEALAIIDQLIAEYLDSDK